MVQTGITPDFITVDGGEGGTGAAPLEFSNHIGAPLIEGLIFVQNALVGFDVRDDIKIFDFGLAKELREELRCKDHGEHGHEEHGQHDADFQELNVLDRRSLCGGGDGIGKSLADLNFGFLMIDDGYFGRSQRARIGVLPNQFNQPVHVCTCDGERDRRAAGGFFGKTAALERKPGVAEAGQPTQVDAVSFFFAECDLQHVCFDQNLTRRHVDLGDVLGDAMVAGRGVFDD